MTQSYGKFSFAQTDVWCFPCIRRDARSYVSEGYQCMCVPVSLKGWNKSSPMATPWVRGCNQLEMLYSPRKVYGSGNMSSRKVC